MKSVMIRLNTINDVKQFVNTVSKCDYDVDLISGRLQSMQNPSWVSSVWIFPNRLNWTPTPTMLTLSSPISKSSSLNNNRIASLHTLSKQQNTLP